MATKWTSLRLGFQSVKAKIQVQHRIAVLRTSERRDYWTVAFALPLAPVAVCCRFNWRVFSTSVVLVSARAFLAMRCAGKWTVVSTHPALLPVIAVWSPAPPVLVDLPSAVVGMTAPVQVPAALVVATAPMPLLAVQPAPAATAGIAIRTMLHSNADIQALLSVLLIVSHLVGGTAR
jgi:hypothetical protein